MTALTYKDAVGRELALTALAGFPHLEQAVTFMKEQGYTISVKGLETIRRNSAEEYEARRTELAPQREASLVSDLLDNATLATEVERIAIERTRTRLNEGKIADTSRVARDLSQVKTQDIDKRMLIQGRPTEIKETRSLAEIVAALEAKGLARRVSIDGSPAVDAEVVEEGPDADPRS